jgi:hypothetical protein
VRKKSEEVLHRLRMAIGPDDRPFREYVERRIRDQVCPHCGSRNVAYVLRGMPLMVPVLEILMLENKVFLGGCMVSEDDKDLFCHHCEKDFDRKRLNIRN